MSSAAHADSDSSTCSGNSGSRAAKPGAKPPALMRMATRTYREFIWSLSFGLVTVATAPFLVVAMLLLGAYKTASDYIRTALSQK